ncbi:hypothetical protein ABID56_000653 [Alkalibacillus flavidus]|uniref:Uncharacterized protein n=1 Tax=Alkalibacillus flavidus TaxID=546021 RepID=A0ABV2KSM1_9BACI
MFYYINLSDKCQQTAEKILTKKSLLNMTFYQF